MLLEQIEWLRKEAFEMMEEAKEVMVEEGAKRPLYPDVSKLSDAIEQHANADKRLAEALCMEKLLQGRCKACAQCLWCSHGQTPALPCLRSLHAPQQYACRYYDSTACS